MGSRGITIDDFERAERRYDEIRRDQTDIGMIAAATGLKVRTVERVKRHLFVDQHSLDRYPESGPVQIRTFEADPVIAGCWDRLRLNRWTENDKQLLRHEMAESWYMRHHRTRSDNAAHNAAQARFPWFPEAGQ